MMLAKLRVILWKNLIIRKRHWILTFTEILIPILLFTLIAYGRSKISGLNKVEIKDPTYQHVISSDEIYIHLPIGELNLWYAPYTDFTENIMRRVQERFQIPGQAIQEFTSEEDLLKRFTKNSSQTIAAFVFRGNDPKNLNYDISLYDKYLRWDTDKLFTSAFDMEDTSGSKYLYKGFAALQLAVDWAFIELNSGKKLTDIDFSIQEFPYPPHTLDSGLSQLFINFLPLITIFSFIFLCPAVLKRVGEEKFSGAKEFMKMVGMKSWMLWLGWFIHALSSYMISIIAIIILMKVPFWGVEYPPIEHSNGVVLFIFLFMYCMAAVTFCFFIATIFNRPTIATIIGILVWVFSYFVPRTIITSCDNLSWKYKILVAIFPNMGLHYGYSAISVYEMREVGIQWNNMFESGSGGEDDVTMGNVLLVFVFDMIIFMLLTVYIENVNPGEYGIAKPFSFPLLNLKNCVKNCFASSRVMNRSSIELLRNDSTVEEGLKRTTCIRIRDLHKKFYNHVAVENLSVDIYENCITVLLGHNGAGKTTTMSMITGMINATKGSIEVNGKDIKEHTDEVRKEMGLCPQHNLLFPDLTVMEHLKFFAMLKGTSSTEAEEQATHIMRAFNIYEKKNDMANTLSGGMKRKLCLGMSLIGNSKVLVLDEPTSGMDPESRRTVWNLLLEYRKSKTIIITTHFMEEADVLGDWIAIMANGCLQCYDTPMRLKRHYNTGYHLSLMLKSNEAVDDITRAIKNQIPEANLLRENGENVVYLLPLDKKTVYEDLFNTLEWNNDKWGITTIGLSITTLNDVFLKAKDEIDAKTKDTISDVDSVNEVPAKIKQDFKKLEGIERNRNIFLSLITKRWYFFKRKFFWYIPAFLVATVIFLITIVLGVSTTDYYNDGGSKLNINLNVYGKTGVFYGGSENYSNSAVSKMKNFYHNLALSQKGEPSQVEDVSKEIIQKGVDNIVYYNQHMIAAAEFNTTADSNKIVVNSMYSRGALHSMPISINLAMNAVVKTVLNESFSIATTNAPLKPIYTYSAPSELSTAHVAVLWLFLVPIAMVFFMSNFIIFPNLEVSTNFLQIQYMAGVRIYVYWFTNIIYDYLMCLVKLIILFVLVTMVISISSTKIFRQEDIAALINILLCYTLFSLPFTYLFSYKKSIAGGFSLFLMVGMFTGITPTVVVRAMELSGDSHYMEIGKYMKHVFLCTCPHFAISYICVKFAQKYVENFNWIYMEPNKRKHMCNFQPNPCCNDETTKECYDYKSYFKNETLGIQSELTEMIVPFILYFALLLFINTQSFKKLTHFVKYIFISHCKRNKFGEDATDSFEHTKIESKLQQNERSPDSRTLYARDLSKSFGRNHIVKNLHMQLEKNKCFGLLGVNGAGKTTTFRMLTKELFFDKGEIAIKDKKQIPISKAEYSEKIGYCPQEDCLNYFLSGRELLYIMALLRGYSKENAEEIVESLLKLFGLEKYAQKSCLEYSGGNKRKLSSCIAFLGFFDFILLDEPTNGVDPASRRDFWNILSTYKKENDTSFLLCSHSMEECEALCDEIGIMKNGQIRNQGTLPDLKSKHQKGYTIEIKLKQTEDDEKIMSVKNDLEAKCTNATFTDEYADLLKYNVMGTNNRLSELFKMMEEIKTKFDDTIDDYTVSQASLEDIFLSVAKEK